MEAPRPRTPETATVTENLDQALDQLMEKRSGAATRVQALGTLIQALSTNYNHEFVSKNSSSLIEALRGCLKRGDAAEKQTAMRLAAVCAITADAASFADAFSASLAPIVADAAAEPALRSAALDLLALLTFIDDDDEVHAGVQACLATTLAVLSPDSELTGAALRSLCVLTSMMTPTLACEQVLSQSFRTVVDCLDHGDVETRVLAGETCALFAEETYLAAEADGTEDDWTLEELASYGVDVDALVCNLKTLATDRSRYISKKNSGIQRSAFAAVIATFEEGLVPSFSLRFNDAVVAFDSWRRIKQMHLLRQFLGVGVQEHMIHNDLLAQLLDFRVDKNWKKSSMSTVEKRLYMSPNSALARSRTQERGASQNMRTSDMWVSQHEDDDSGDD